MATTSLKQTTESIVLGMGCFWGAEKRMSAIHGVIDVESGYANGEIEGSYEAVLAQERLLRLKKSAQKNHAEVVRVTFDPNQVPLEDILATFWESHDPTQGDRQGNDIGTNYRSAIYFVNESQQKTALRTRDCYQSALSAVNYGAITTEIAPLACYYPAEDYHQDYLVKNPHGYCGLGGTGVVYPRCNIARDTQELILVTPIDNADAHAFKATIFAQWRSAIPILELSIAQLAANMTLSTPVVVSPTILLVSHGVEVSRYQGFDGNAQAFWQWLGSQTLTDTEKEIAFDHGTEYPFTGKHLNEKRKGRFVDPISGETLFTSDAKFESGCGWPSFTTPSNNAITFHHDDSHRMRRTEVRSASTGIHLGHVFDDGPLPQGTRYCINGNVLKFIPDEENG